jgi:hypothetical protein
MLNAAIKKENPMLYSEDTDLWRYKFEKFDTIDLQGLKTIGLMKRYDTKFVFNRSMLPFVIDFMHHNYFVLEMDNKQVFEYITLYYDTKDRLFYRQHHDQRVNRYKVRCRNYVDTKKCYIEVKFKNNKNKTIKTRQLLDDQHIRPELSDESKDFARYCFNNGNRNIVDVIMPVLWVAYKRMTFANPSTHERITIDIDLRFNGKNRDVQLDYLVIAELKKASSSQRSDFFQWLKTLSILPTKFSKYCMGIVLTEQGTKSNRFKKKIRQINRLAEFR